MAFQGTYDRAEDGEPSDDALLGAVMTSEFQCALLDLLRGYYQVHKA